MTLSNAKYTETLATGQKAHKPTVFGCYVDLKGFAMSEYLQAYALFYLLIIDK